MFELTLSVCLFASPIQCKNVHLTFVGENKTIFQCMKHGQIEIAKWSHHNRDWRVKKWRCGPIRTTRSI